MSTLVHFRAKKSPKSRLGGVLGRLVGVLSQHGGVLRRLGAVLGRLGVVLGRLGSVLQAPERETMNFQWFSDFLWGWCHGRVTGVQGRAMDPRFDPDP